MNPADAKTRILLLEDDEAFRESVEDALVVEGYDVVAVDRGEAAVQQAREGRYNIIVTDIRMDGMSGLEALDLIQQTQPGIYSLVMTGYSSEKDTIKAVKLGVEDYLKKPFSLDELLHAVHKIDKRRKSALKANHRERAILSTALSALNQLVSKSCPKSTQSGSIASRLALSLGLDEVAAKLVELATLSTVLSRSPNPDFGQKLGQSLPNLAKTALEDFDRPFQSEDGSFTPLESRIVAVAASMDTDTQTAEALAAKWPDRFDPQVLGALSQLSEDSTSSEKRSPAEEARQLFSLARALEMSGDFKGAAKAYRTVVEGPASRQRVDALLHMSRITGALGDAAKAISFAFEAYKAGMRSGPQAAAITTIDAGLLVLQFDSASKAQKILSEALKRCQEIGISSGVARAKLALASTGMDMDIQDALDTMLDRQNYSLLARSGVWLIPFLLERPEASEDSKEHQVLSLIARDFPLSLAQLAATGSQQVRLRAISLLKDVGGEEARTALNKLSKDPDPEVGAAASKAAQAESDNLLPPALRIYSVGNLELFRGPLGIDMRPWNSKKARELMVLLATRRDRPVPEEQLIDIFWPDELEAGRNGLYHITSLLRRKLRPPDWPDKLNYLIRDNAMLSLNSSLPIWHDYEELNKALEASEQKIKDGFPAEAAEYSRTVSELYRGPFMDGCYLDWAIRLREELERKVCQNLSTFSEFLYQSQRYLESIELALRIVNIDPTFQEVHSLLIRTYAAHGRPELGVKHFKDTVKMLRNDYEIEPTIDMERAHQEALLRT